MRYGVRFVLAAGLMALGCGTEPPADDGDEGDGGEAVAAARGELASFGGFEAAYVDCDEFAGVGLVPIENVAGRVPGDYVVVEPVPGSALVVAQGGRCDEISVGGRERRRGIFAQFGVGVVPPTGGVDGNFYQLMYATDHPGLAARLRLFGANARYAPGLDFDLDPGPALRVFVPRPAPLAWELNGPVTLPDPLAPPNPVTTFNYWHRSPFFGNVLQENVVSGIRFGEGGGVVMTALGPEMEEILGGPTLSFAFFSKPEIFDRADVSVRTNAF